MPDYTITPSFDYFAFPRTGSHYFGLCLQGLYEEILTECGGMTQSVRPKSKEESSRSKELRPAVLYVLNCRLPGRGAARVARNANPGGVLHEAPHNRGNKIVITIRHPFPTIYSLYRLLNDRMQLDVGDLKDFVSNQLDAYRRYYQAAFSLQQQGSPVLFVRYEDLLNSRKPLEELCEFLQVRPKLPVGLVYVLTRFHVITKLKKRTFYRSGNNKSWKNNLSFMKVLSCLPSQDYSMFGYGD